MENVFCIPKFQNCNTKCSVGHHSFSVAARNIGYRQRYACMVHSMNNNAEYIPFLHGPERNLWERDSQATSTCKCFMSTVQSGTFLIQNVILYCVDRPRRQEGNGVEKKFSFLNYSILVEEGEGKKYSRTARRWDDIYIFFFACFVCVCPAIPPRPVLINPFLQCSLPRHHQKQKPAEKWIIRLECWVTLVAIIMVLIGFKWMWMYVLCVWAMAGLGKGLPPPFPKRNDACNML